MLDGNEKGFFKILRATKEVVMQHRTPIYCLRTDSVYIPKKYLVMRSIDLLTKDNENIRRLLDFPISYLPLFPMAGIMFPTDKELNETVSIDGKNLYDVRIIPDFTDLMKCSDDLPNIILTAYSRGEGDIQLSVRQQTEKSQYVLIKIKRKGKIIYPSSFKLQQMTSGIDPSNPLLQLKKVANWSKMGIEVNSKDLAMDKGSIIKREEFLLQDGDQLMVNDKYCLQVSLPEGNKGGCIDSSSRVYGGFFLRKIR